MKKILITGGSGFIGTNFIERLNKKNLKYVTWIKFHLSQHLKNLNN